nr:hypothetical protein [Candidatus Sigynarchaeum springense]
MRTKMRSGLIVALVIAAGACVPFFLDAAFSLLRHAPEPGDEGYTGMSRIGTASMYLGWTPATDDFTPCWDLEYRVYGSFEDNIDSVENIENFGVPLCDWAPRFCCFTVGDTPYYYFNVMVRDQDGNAAAYNPFKYGGQFDDLAGTLQWLSGNIENRSELVTVDLQSENDTRLALTGLAMMQTNETYSAEALQQLGARYVLIQFGYLVNGLCGDEFKSIPLIQACNNRTAELVAMGLEHENWYGESGQVTTVFDEAEYHNATCAPEPKWFDTTLAKLSFHDVPTSTSMATTQLEYWYARQINGYDGVHSPIILPNGTIIYFEGLGDEDYVPLLAADWNPWGDHIPTGGNYTLTNFTEVFRSTSGLLKIYEIA